MRTLSYNFLALLMAMFALAGCQPQRSTDNTLSVFAAASLSDAMVEVQQAFHEDYPHLKVQLNIAGSNVLARQIRAGAKADLFFSANSHWMDDLQSGGYVDASSRRRILRNQLVLIQHPKAQFALTHIEQLPELAFRYLAVGNPQVVPAGVYAKQFLSAVGGETGSVWDALERRIAPAADVRRALAMVAADPSVLGLVYGSDLVQMPDMQVLYAVPQEDVTVIYEAAILRTDSVHPMARNPAQQFLNFLEQPKAQAIFFRQGFGVSD